MPAPRVVQHAGVRLVTTAAGDVYSVLDDHPGPGLVMHNDRGPAFVSVRGECVYYVNGVKHRDPRVGCAVLRNDPNNPDEFWSEGVLLVRDGMRFRPWGTLAR